MAEQKPPLPLFDTLSNLSDALLPDFSARRSFCLTDYRHAQSFINSYNGSQATFNAYRREIERLLHWSWQFVEKSVCELRRTDIEAYLQFCQKPPTSWIGLKKVPRFISQEGKRMPNPAWRAFVVTLSKSALRQGQQVDVKEYSLSEIALKEVFAILSSFYNFLIQEEATEVNPVAHIRQKSKFLRKRQGKPNIKVVKSIVTAQLKCSNNRLDPELRLIFS